MTRQERRKRRRQRRRRMQAGLLASRSSLRWGLLVDTPQPSKAAPEPVAEQDKRSLRRNGKRWHT